MGQDLIALWAEVMVMVEEGVAPHIIARKVKDTNADIRDFRQTRERKDRLRGQPRPKSRRAEVEPSKIENPQGDENDPEEASPIAFRHATGLRYFPFTPRGSTVSGRQ